MKQKEAELYTKVRKESLEEKLKKRRKRKRCDHKVNNNSMLNPVGNPVDRKVCCELCHDEFSVKVKSRSEVAMLINGVSDMINCIKVAGSTVHEDSLPDKVLDQLADTLVFLESLPKIYERIYVSTMEPSDDFDDERGNSLSNGIIIGKPIKKCGRDTVDIYYKKKHNKKDKNKDKKKKKKKHKIDKDLLSLLD